MTNLTASQIFEALSNPNLTTNELLVINKRLVTILKMRQTAKAQNASMDLAPGQVVSFKDRDGLTRFIRIEKFNRARTTVKGPEVRADGSSMGHLTTTWNVSATLVSVVTK